MLRYHAIGEEGVMFYNHRGQLCLRLFDFQTVPADQPSTRWMPKKIIGDECQVFMLQPESADMQSQMESESKPVQFHEPSDQLFNGDNFDYKYQLNNRENNQEGYRNDIQSTLNMPNHSHHSEARTASSVAETPNVPVTDPPSSQFEHGRDVRIPWKQESLHQPSGSEAPICAQVVSHDQQAPDSASCGNGAQSADQPLNAVDVNSQAGTGNDDACGRDRRDGGPFRT